MNSLERTSTDSIIGCLLGTAIGDAVGLPYEGLSKARAARMLGPPDRHRFLFGRGMVSDDTEHTCIVAQCLIACGGQVATFEHELARRLRHWLMLGPAGIGLATLRACLRLWVGVSPKRSGIFSAGNGPAMRAAILGAAVRDLELLRELVSVSTRITHTDPKAEYGALAVAFAARYACENENVQSHEYLRQFRDLAPEDADSLVDKLTAAADSAAAGESTETFAISLGLKRGVTGYVYHSVPVAIHAWFANSSDLRTAVTGVIRCGGDTDTTAAIVGGIVGARVGRSGIPKDWLDGMWEWPRNVSWLEKLGSQLGQVLISKTPERPLRLTFCGTLLRNAFFLAVVLFHGFRRLLPPY
jgi:ADP-ribosyl-[dinitrogen reductase] hydrolase